MSSSPECVKCGNYIYYGFVICEECTMGTITILKKAIKKNQKRIDELENTKHPQLQLTREKLKSEKQAFEAVLQSLRGNSLLLKCYTDDI